MGFEIPGPIKAYIDERVNTRTAAGLKILPMNVAQIANLSLQISNLQDQIVNLQKQIQSHDDERKAYTDKQDLELELRLRKVMASDMKVTANLIDLVGQILGPVGVTKAMRKWQPVMDKQTCENCKQVHYEWDLSPGENCKNPNGCRCMLIEKENRNGLDTATAATNEKTA